MLWVIVLGFLVGCSCASVVLACVNLRTFARIRQVRHAIEAEREKQHSGIVILTLHEVTAANTMPVAQQRRRHFFLN